MSRAVAMHPSGRSPMGLTRDERGVRGSQATGHAAATSEVRGARVRRAGEAETAWMRLVMKTVIEGALEVELADHLGYPKHAAAGRNGRNSRNGKRSKTVVIESLGDIEIDVPRDRDSTFAPQLVNKRRHRLPDLSDLVVGMFARDLTAAEAHAQLSRVYGGSVSTDVVQRIVHRINDKVDLWWARPLASVYLAVVIDLIAVLPGGPSADTKRVLAAIGVTQDGSQDVVGIWPSPATGSAEYWVKILTSMRDRGAREILSLVCDGLRMDSPPNVRASP